MQNEHNSDYHHSNHLCHYCGIVLDWEETEMMSNEEQLRRISMVYEKKLIELMGEAEFVEFSKQIARELFAEEICHMADGDFKETILDNFDAITGSDEDYQRLMGNIETKGDCQNCVHCIPAGMVSFCECPTCDFEALGGDQHER